MILLRTFLLLFVALVVVAAPSTSVDDATSADITALVARARPQKPANAPPGGRPPWAGKYGGKLKSGQAKPQVKAQADASRSQSEDSNQAQAQPQSNADSSSGGSSGRGGRGGKGGSSDQSQSESAPPEGSSQQQQKPQSPPPPASGGSGGGSGYMAIVSRWRGAMGLPAFAQDSKLEANAMDCSQSSGGKLKHKLNPGSMGQVMAPGNSGNFESVFVGGWLCEIPSLPGLGSATCGTMTKGWNHAGQTGHAKILSDPKYKKIGCALASGIWTCDVA